MSDKQNLKLACLQDKVARFVASGAYSGLSPKAPGTVGSFLAVLTSIPLWEAGRIWLLLAAVLSFFIGIWAIKRCHCENSDPSWVVIDEISAQWLVFTVLPALSFWSLLAGFILFRFFDITKIRPIKNLDARHDAWGIMLDDTLAAVFAAVILGILSRFLPL